MPTFSSSTVLLHWLVYCSCLTFVLGTAGERVPDRSDDNFGRYECGDRGESVGIARITVADFLRWTSIPLADGHPLYSIVRVREPWADVPRDPKTKEDVLNVVAKELCVSNVTSPVNDPPHFVRIGELLLDTEDSWVLVNSIGMQQFPAVIAFGTKWVRAFAPKGGVQHGRVLPVPLPWPPTPESPAVLRRQILANVPTRFYDGVTGMPHDALHFVDSRKEIYQQSAMRQLQLQVRNVSVMPSLAFVVRLRLSEKGDAAHLAALSSVAAELGSNAVVHVTEDADVASRFGVKRNRGFAAFAYPFPDDVSLPITPLVAPPPPSHKSAIVTGSRGRDEAENADDVVVTPLDLASALLEYFPASERSARPAEQRMSAIRSEWKRDVELLNTHPLRRIDTQLDFDASVASAKLSIVILYFLRESDDYFMRYYKSAEEVASAVHNAWAKGSRLSALRERVRFEVFWMDAEIHKEAARGFKTASVPSVAFLYGLQDGNRGVRYVFGSGSGGSKKGSVSTPTEFPTAAEVLDFMTGPNLMDASGKGMFPLDLSTIHLAPPEDVAALRKKLAPSRKLTLSESPLSTNTDWKLYPTSEPKENTFVRDVIEGRIALQEETKDASSSSSGKSKKKTSVDAKKKAKLEKERKKIEAELAEKQRKKEERMRAKAAADEKQRAEEISKAQEVLRKQAKQQKSRGDRDSKPPSAAEKDADDTSHDDRGEVGGGGAAQHRGRWRRSDGEPILVPRPKFNPMKGPKNRHEQKRQLEQYRKVMIAERLRASSGRTDTGSSGGFTTGGGVFDRSFEL